MVDDATIGNTVEHDGPMKPVTSPQQAGLLMAFPRPLRLDIPRDGEQVGRRWLQGYRIADQKVSGRHVYFRRDGNKLAVCDVASRNGTFVNGERLAANAEQPLRDGDVLRVGNTLAVYRTTVDPKAPHPPLGAMVAPFGMTAVRRSLVALQHAAPRNVLIEGETGTGKELAARAVAQLLGRDTPYVAVNMAGVPAGVFEAQLFGHVAGAFSDAKAASKGLIAAHEGGAVCLDEFGELPLALQPKLLRLLDNREVQPVGAERPVTVEVLIIASTNQNLRQLAARGEFRLDLVARMAMARISLPPLRDRREDIFHIARALSGDALNPDEVEVEAVEQLLLQPWPTNVRGVAAVLAEVRVIDPQPGLRAWAVEQVLAAQRADEQLGAAPRPATFGESMDGLRSATSPPLSDARIEQALAACGGNETQAAKWLGVSRGKLRRYLAKRS